jgi:ribosomal protein L31E
LLSLLWYAHTFPSPKHHESATPWALDLEDSHKSHDTSHNSTQRMRTTKTTNTSLQGTRDVRLDPQLNKKVWESGIKGVPYRLRVRISRKRNDEEGAKEKLYSYVQAVNVKSAKGLQTVVVEDA